MQHKVLVEFSVDPTEFTQSVRLTEDKVLEGEPYPDTPRVARRLVEASLAGEADPLPFNIPREIFHCRVSQEQAGLTPTTLDCVSAILETLRQFRKIPRTQYISNVTCHLADGFFEVSLWGDNSLP